MFRNFVSTHYKKPLGLLVSGIGLLTGSYYLYNYKYDNLVLIKKTINTKLTNIKFYIHPSEFDIKLYLPKSAHKHLIINYYFLSPEFKKYVITQYKYIIIDSNKSIYYNCQNYNIFLYILYKEPEFIDNGIYTVPNSKYVPMPELNEDEAKIIKYLDYFSKYEYLYKINVYESHVSKFKEFFNNRNTYFDMKQLNNNNIFADCIINTNYETYK